MPQLQLLSTLPGHTEPAWSVAFNPTRSLLASCSTDKTVRLYSYILPQPSSSSSSSSASTYPKPDDPRPTFSLSNVITTKHKRTVRSIAWAPSGRTLATASFDSSVGVWEEVDPESLETDEAEGVFWPGSGDGDEVGRSGGGGGGGKEWECITTLEGHDSECKSVGFSSDGGLLASCSRDTSVWVWEVQPDADFECIAVMMDHTQDVKSLAWHPHEEILASASYDSHIHLLFDDPDGDWCAFQKLHPSLPPSAPNVPPALAQAFKDGEEGFRVPPLMEDETVWSVAWSPCGRYMASGGDLGGVRIWARQGNQPDSRFVEAVHASGHSRSCFTLSWSPGGTPSDQGGLGLLASGGGDGKIIIWQVSLPPSMGDGTVNGDQAKARPAVRISPIAVMRDAHEVSDVNSVGWCLREDGKGLGMLASAGDDGGVKVWRLVEDEGSEDYSVGSHASQP